MRHVLEILFFMVPYLTVFLLKRFMSFYSFSLPLFLLLLSYFGSPLPDWSVYDGQPRWQVFLLNPTWGTGQMRKETTGGIHNKCAFMYSSCSTGCYDVPIVTYPASISIFSARLFSTTSVHTRATCCFSPKLKILLWPIHCVCFLFFLIFFLINGMSDLTRLFV